MKTRFFDDVKSLEELKKRYRDLARRNHPDLGGSVEIMQQINSEYDKMIEYFAKHGSKQEKERATAEVPKEFRDLISKLVKLSELQIEIIGSWIWLSGNTAKYLRKIQSLGFNYSTKQKRYYKGDAKTAGARASRYSMQDIREIYGSTIIDTEKVSLLA